MSETKTTGRAITAHHAAHKRIYDYWNALRNGRIAPQRIEIDPTALRDVLTNIMILEWRARDQLVFRIAGTSICATFGRELRDHNFVSLWEEPSRDSMISLLENIRQNAECGLIRLSAETLDKTAYKGELLLLPLAETSGMVTRAIGSFYLDRSLDILGFHKLIRMKAEDTKKFNPATNQLIAESQDEPRPYDRPLALVKTQHISSAGRPSFQKIWSDKLASFLEPTRE